MGKSIPSSEKFQQFSRLVASSNRSPRRFPLAQFKPVSYPDSTGARPAPHPLKLNSRRMEVAENSGQRQRAPLADVVADCVNRWFKDTLREARNGDIAMQVLVGQMYCSGYGVARDPQKGTAWIDKASRTRSSVWKVGDKHPGYNASDSDSDVVQEDTK